MMDDAANVESPCAPAAPESFAQRVLLTVAGLTPQIITESVYALAVARRPPFIPTRIVVLTTTEGANRVRLMLQGSDPGWLRCLSEEYELPPVELAENDVITLSSSAGPPLSDIRTEADNADAADIITETIRGLTSDDASALHVSIAGGRKTLGFFAGYALSLYGRPQDRLSHVLVSPPFESNQGFFYPTRERRIIFGPPPGNEPLDAAKAEVMLADIPFVRMRHGLPQALREGRASFREAVAAVQRRLDLPSLVIDLARQRVTAGAITFALEPAVLAFYAWVVRRHLVGDPVRRPGNRNVDHQACAREFLAEYLRLRDSARESSIRATLKSGMGDDFFDQHASKLKRALARHLDIAASSYALKRFGARGYSCYRVDLPPAAISIIDPA